MASRGSFENGPDRAGERRPEAAPVAPRVMEKARRADEKLVALVQERPIAALCAAVLAGYIVGRVVTRVG
jgi:hypothetical protein